MAFRSKLLLKRFSELHPRLTETEEHGKPVSSLEEKRLLLIGPEESSFERLAETLSVSGWSWRSSSSIETVSGLTAEAGVKLILSIVELESLEGFELKEKISVGTAMRLFLYVSAELSLEAEALVAELKTALESMSRLGVDETKVDEAPTIVNEGEKRLEPTSLGKPCSAKENGESSQAPKIINLATAEEIIEAFKVEGRAHSPTSDRERPELEERGATGVRDDPKELIQRYLEEFRRAKTEPGKAEAERDRLPEDPSNDVPSVPEFPEFLTPDKAVADRPPVSSMLDAATEDSLVNTIGIAKVPEKEASSPPESEDCYLRAIAYVLRAIRSASEGRLPDLHEAEELVDTFMDALDADNKLILSATNRNQEFAISSHSVNVSVLSICISKELPLNNEKIRRIGIAGLLHELGVVRLPESLVHETGMIKPEDLKKLRLRPLLTNSLLRDLEAGYEWLNEVVSQVFERENGTGAPRGLAGEEICEEAKIVGIADLFDACIHRRPYRNPLTGYETLFQLTSKYLGAFPEHIIKALVKAVSLYPYNEYVVLDTGEIGRVIELNRENLSRPVVKVLLDKDQEPIQTERVVDLASAPERYIARAVTLDFLPRIN